MIKLTRPPKPEYLTPERESELVQKFKTDKSAVWKKQQITEPLLHASHNKCAYCECRLQEADSYMEVEHFKHKDKYESEVVHWPNLLPSCKRCNTKKGVHDVVSDPIVDPFSMNPADYLELDMAYIRHKGEIGQATVEVLDLNSIDRLVIPRFKITTQIETNLVAIQDALDLFLQNKSTRRRNKLIGTFKETLIECQPNSIFSATAATFIHRNAKYNMICEAVKAEGIWDDELEQLHQTSKSICLDG